VARRLHAVLLNHQHYTSGEIAQLLQAPRSKVSRWLAQYEREGWPGLLEGHRSGRPKQLTSAQVLELERLIDRGPSASGFSGGVWTSAMIGRVIQKEFGVGYHPGHVRKVLQALGWSARGTRRKRIKAPPREPDPWQRYTAPRRPQ
jgi:transposase